VPEAIGGGTPTPAITLPAAARARFAAAAVPVPDTLIDRLRAVCRVIDTSVEGRHDAGRDWWPLATGWALAGEAAAMAAVVARPTTAGEVAAVLAACDHARIPVTPAGGGSGVSGGAIPIFGGVLLDMTGLAGIAAVDDESLLVDVGPGTFGDVLETDLRRDHGLTLGHWPQSMALSTVGGWVACRSAGQYSTRYGKIEDMVAGLDVALADGRVIRTGGAAPRSATGPDLNHVFLGSEGTLGVITSVRLRVHPMAAAERRAAYGFPSFEAGLDACRRTLRRGATPAVIRLYDALESGSGFPGLAPEGSNVLIVVDEGDPAIVDAAMAVVADEAGTAGANRLDDALVERWMARRLDVGALEKALRAGLTVDTIEVAARWSVLSHLHHEVMAGVGAVAGTVLASVHQSHAYGDGACLYFTFAGDVPPGTEAGEAYYRQVWDVAMAATAACGGAISHHHGIGLNRGRHLAPALGPAFDVLVAMKAALDPNGVLNPGKLGLPSPFGPPPWP
jgi:alkyldihydroxyacetonephosphate synthase